jgi:hypothetical protein
MSANMEWTTVVTTALDWAVLAGVAFYGTFVFLHYFAHGTRPRPVLDLNKPARSAEDLAVWMGVRLVAVGVRAGKPVLSMLSEASADVGDWFLSNLNHQSR